MQKPIDDSMGRWSSASSAPSSLAPRFPWMAELQRNSGREQEAVMTLNITGHLFVWLGQF